MSSLGIQKAARIKAIHAACRAAGIGDDERRAMQQHLTGRESLADMSFAEVSKVLDHLNQATGWKGHAGKPQGIDDDAQLQKIEALLADQKLPWAYLHSGKTGPSMVRRLTGKDRIEWADSTGKAAVITALIKRQAKAAG